MARLLLENGADINYQDHRGYTALHYAVSGTHMIAEVELLLKLGAAPRLRGLDGKTAIDLAEGKPKLLVALLGRL